MRLLGSQAPWGATTTGLPAHDAPLPTQRTASPDAAVGADQLTGAPPETIDADLTESASGIGRGLLVGALPATSGLPASLVGRREPTPLVRTPTWRPIAPPLLLLSLRRRLAFATAVMVVIAVAGAGMTVAAEQRAATQAAVDAHAAVIAAQVQVAAAERVVLREEYNAASWAQTLAKQATAAAAGVVAVEAARLALAGAPQAGDELRGASQASIDAASAVVSAVPNHSVLTIQAAVASINTPLQAAVAAQAAWQVAEAARIAAEQAAAEAAAAQAAAAAKAASAQAPRTTTTRRATTTAPAASAPAAAVPAPASNVPEFSAGELGVSVERAVEVARFVVEVARLPHLRRLVSRRGEREPAHRVLDEHPSTGPVDLEAVGVGVGVRGVVGAQERPDRPAGELQRDSDRGVGTRPGFVALLTHDRRDRAAQVLEHVQSVDLGLDEVGVRRGPEVGLAAEAPGREDDLAELARLDRAARALDRLGIAVVEVDREEQVLGGRCGEQGVGLVEIEDEGLLDEQCRASGDQVHGRGEVRLVRQAHSDQVRLFAVEHRIEIGVRGRRERVRANLGPLGIPADDGAQRGVPATGEHARMLLAPLPGPDDGDLERPCGDRRTGAAGCS